jgi:hypothetical protein
MPRGWYGSVEVRAIVADDEVTRSDRSEPMLADLTPTDEFGS